MTRTRKLRMVSSEATAEDSSGDDRGGSGSGSGGPSAQGCSISKTISTVSDITDSNRGSCSNNSGSGGGSSDDGPTELESRESSGNGEDEDEPSNSSISSDAAVASEKTSRDRNTGHKDVVFNNDKRMSRKRPPEEVTSLERSFELNYEEVFDKSNIPQLIASTSGKIATWNECFIKATGYRKSEIERMTIFSLVKPENLANFFDIVAAALRPNECSEKNDCSEKSTKANDKPSTREDKEMENNVSPSRDTHSSATVDISMMECKTEKDGEEGRNTDLRKDESDVGYNKDSTRLISKERVDDANKPVEGTNFISSIGNSSNTTVKEESQGWKESTNQMKEESTANNLLGYTAMTLPCIDFPAMRKRNQAAADSDSINIPPLHVTVTLMADNDPRRRCFHCVFTNSKGTNGSLGIITPELLASLFAKPLRRRKKHHSSHSHQRKRSRGGARQSVSNEKHHVQTISNEQPERAPSPLLMPPPGPLGEEENKEEENKVTNTK